MCNPRPVESSRPRPGLLSQVSDFREKLRWPLDELVRASKDEGISHGALYEARDLLKPESVVDRIGRGRVTYWQVDADWPPFNDPKWNAGIVEVAYRNQTQTVEANTDMSVPEANSRDGTGASRPEPTQANAWEGHQMSGNR